MNSSLLSNTCFTLFYAITLTKMVTVSEDL